MGKMHIKYAIMKGAELVAALDCNPDQIGMDAGELAGIGSIGIPISDSNNTTAILTETKPDIVIMATRSFLSDCKDSILECVACGVNVITICEEALWPFATSSEAATEIDEVAKKYGVSVCGTGFADVFWGNLPAMIFGSAARITKIHGSCIVNLEDYGDVLAERHGVGLTLDEYKKRFGEGKSTKNGAELKDTCFLGDQNGWICKYLGLTIQNQSLIDYPLTSSRELFCTPMNLKVPAGNVIGSSTVSSTETTEGITVEFEIGGKAYEEGDIDSTKWVVTGDPSTEVVISQPPTPQLTCTISINRIPDVINAAPGYVTTDQLPFNRYLIRPLNEYVNKQ